MRFSLVAALVVANFSLFLRASAEDLTCRKGTSSQAFNYKSTVELLQKGERLTAEQEGNILESLELAVSNQCKNAALILFDIKVNQAAALSLTSRAEELNKIEDEEHSLLLKAKQIGEGDFELGGFYLSVGSKYHSPKKALDNLELAAKKGDERAVALLIKVYENGIGGVSIDLPRANYWKQQLKR